MQAIQTKYHGPTNTRGTRISAKCSAGRISLPWDHSLNFEENHRKAAEALIVKLHWHRNHSRVARPAGRPEDCGGEPRPVWYSGGLDDGTTVHVCAWPDAAMDVSGHPARPYVSPLS